MKLLDPSENTPLTIEPHDTTQFEGFLDRNFPGWRDREIFKSKFAGTIRRKWVDGHDGIERNAVFRNDFVEIYDEFIEIDERADDALIHPLKRKLCAIDGDLTPVAQWGNRKLLG